VRIGEFADWITIVGFIVGLPTIAATYLQAVKARKIAEETRRELIFSQDCLEFVSDSGDFVNLVLLEQLHTLPRVGDIVLLPGDGLAAGAGPYRVDRIEYIYAQDDPEKCKQPRQAKLTKAVAHVTNLLEEGW
jgi:hypothetical protein